MIIKKKKGFTLVELLAVIVILAIVLVIAVPKVMSVIEDSKKATLESTAKMIASSAEKAKVQNTVLGKTDSITCDSVAKINKLDYEDCDIDFEENTAKVTIKGKGKFEGLNVCEGTKTTAVAQEESCKPDIISLKVETPFVFLNEQLSSKDFEIIASYSDGTSKTLENGAKLKEGNEKFVISSPNWPENYPENMTKEENYWEKTFEGADAIKITFDKSSRTEELNDLITIYDKSGKVIDILAGNFLKDSYGASYIVYGNYVKITMQSDSSTNYYKGFSAELKAMQYKDTEYTVSPAIVPNKSGNFEVTISLLENNMTKKVTLNALESPTMVNFLEALASYELSAWVKYGGLKYDYNTDTLRYTTRNNTNNKVYFNCEDIDSNDVTYGSDDYDYENSCEVWRIIGVFDTKENHSATPVKRVKIINSASTFTAAYDSSPSGINSGWGVNQWGKSTYEDGRLYEGADLMRLLNGYYIGEDTKCRYCNAERQETCEQVCDTQDNTLASQNMKPLTLTAKSMIKNAVWYNYAKGEGNSYNTIYSQEKGISSKYIGCSGIDATTSKICDVDGIIRDNEWIGLVGLMSKSDANVENWSNSSAFVPWTLTPSYEYSHLIWNTDCVDGYSCSTYRNYGVWPSVYLSEDVKIVGGDGSTTPYKLGL